MHSALGFYGVIFCDIFAVKIRICCVYPNIHGICFCLRNLRSHNHLTTTVNICFLFYLKIQSFQFIKSIDSWEFLAFHIKTIFSLRIDVTQYNVESGLSGCVKVVLVEANYSARQQSQRSEKSKSHYLSSTHCGNQQRLAQFNPFPCFTLKAGKQPAN